MKRLSILLLVTLGLPVFLAACAATPTASTPSAASASAEDKQWTMQNKNYASTRYSGLDSINTGNIKDLKVAWTFSTGVLHERKGDFAGSCSIPKPVSVISSPGATP